MDLHLPGAATQMASRTAETTLGCPARLPLGEGSGPQLRGRPAADGRLQRRAGQAASDPVGHPAVWPHPGTARTAREWEGSGAPLKRRLRTSHGSARRCGVERTSGRWRDFNGRCWRVPARQPLREPPPTSGPRQRRLGRADRVQTEPKGGGHPLRPRADACRRGTRPCVGHLSTGPQNRNQS